MPSAATKSKHRQNRWAWMWLAYTGFMLIQPLMEPSRLLWFGTITSLAVFFFIFWRFFYLAESPAAHYGMLVATFVLGLVTFPWNQGGSTFFIYAAAFLPFILNSARRVVVLILLECVAILAECAIFNVIAPHGPFHI
jgi:two-component system sensor histidine kinase DesK